MSKFIFTPEQRKEAIEWLMENCIDLINLVETFEPEEAKQYGLDNLVDMYFKLKTVPFSFKPNEFIVGIEYNKENAVKTGAEVPNVHINNPHKKLAGQTTHDEFALVILYTLFKNSQI